MSKSPTSIQDERVIMEENKYRSEALLITEVALVLSIITKEYILKLWCIHLCVDCWSVAAKRLITRHNAVARSSAV